MKKSLILLSFVFCLTSLIFSGALSSDEALIVNEGEFASPSFVITALTGAIKFTNGSTAIVGDSTLFTAELAEGDIIYDTTDKFAVIVATITNATAAVAYGKYQGTGGATHTCKRLRNSDGIGPDIPARYDVVLPISTANPVKVGITDWRISSGGSLYRSLVNKLKLTSVVDGYAVWVKATSVANELVAAWSMFTATEVNAGQRPLIFLDAGVEYEFDCERMLDRGFSLYVRSAGAASTFDWYAYQKD